MGQCGIATVKGGTSRATQAEQDSKKRNSAISTLQNGLGGENNIIGVNASEKEEANYDPRKRTSYNMHR